MLLTAAPICVPLLVFPEFILKTLFIPEYVSSAPVLRVFAVYMLVVSLGIVAAQYVVSSRMERTYFVSVIMGGILSITLCLVLIPRMAGYGAAMALLIAHGTTMGLYWLAMIQHVRRMEKKMTKNNVCSEVVASNLCIGCGMCAAICPKGNLEIRFNEYGEYNAFESKTDCLEKCNLCLKVCPFSDNEGNEDTIGKRLFADIPGIKHTPETGYFLDSFVGYSKIDDHRTNGASGGMATWALETVLKENLVDYVACVSHSNTPDKLFEFTICKTQEEVRLCSRSCYYPVEASQIVEHILTNEGRYAVILLPCFAKAFRLGDAGATEAPKKSEVFTGFDLLSKQKQVFL